MVTKEDLGHGIPSWCEKKGEVSADGKVEWVCNCQKGLVGGEEGYCDYPNKVQEGSREEPITELWCMPLANNSTG